MSRRVVALIFGGRSPEHEVSVVSARGIFAHLDPTRWDVRLVGVTRRGEPRVGGSELLTPSEVKGGGEPAFWPSNPDRRAFHSQRGEPLTPAIDVAFPIIHGAGGEDGSLQGILASAGIPFVGAGVLGSSLAMDKDRCRRILAAAGIPVVDDLVFEGPAALELATVTQQAACLGYPLFVKPARAGSSVGISKVHAAEQLMPALQAAYAVDTKVVLERAIPAARELETAVLGNLAPRASIVGEIVPHGEFYDYHAKYQDPESRLLIPAPIEPELSDRIRTLAVRAFRELDLMGMARIDFLYSPTSGELVLNEPNTLPGFTPISMYPKLWVASGLPYPQLLDRLIELAIESASLGALRCASASSPTGS
jgi:D-alanine-D-alanine ligase